MDDAREDIQEEMNDAHEETNVRPADDDKIPEGAREEINNERVRDFASTPVLAVPQPGTSIDKGLEFDLSNTNRDYNGTVLQQQELLDLQERVKRAENAAKKAEDEAKQRQDTNLQIQGLEMRLADNIKQQQEERRQQQETERKYQAMIEASNRKHDQLMEMMRTYVTGQSNSNVHSWVDSNNQSQEPANPVDNYTPASTITKYEDVFHTGGKTKPKKYIEPTPIPETSSSDENSEVPSILEEYESDDDDTTRMKKDYIKTRAKYETMLLQNKRSNIDEKFIYEALEQSKKMKLRREYKKTMPRTHSRERSRSKSKERRQQLFTKADNDVEVNRPKKSILKGSSQPEANGYMKTCSIKDQNLGKSQQHLSDSSYFRKTESFNDKLDASTRRIEAEMAKWTPSRREEPETSYMTRQQLTEMRSGIESSIKREQINYQRLNKKEDEARQVMLAYMEMDDDRFPSSERELIDIMSKKKQAHSELDYLFKINELCKTAISSENKKTKRENS